MSSNVGRSRSAGRAIEGEHCREQRRRTAAVRSSTSSPRWSRTPSSTFIIGISSRWARSRRAQIEAEAIDFVVVEVHAALLQELREILLPRLTERQPVDGQIILQSPVAVRELAALGTSRARIR